MEGGAGGVADCDGAKGGGRVIFLRGGKCACRAGEMG